jgi:hypothetical protein
LRLTGQFLHALGKHQGKDRNGACMIEVVSMETVAETHTAEFPSFEGPKGILRMHSNRHNR